MERSVQKDTSLFLIFLFLKAKLKIWRSLEINTNLSIKYLLAMFYTRCYQQFFYTSNWKS